MIDIVIPNNNVSERKYIIDTVFKHFFNIEYNLIISKIDISEYQFLFQDKKIIILDSFFSKYLDNLEYLNIKNIPYSLTYIRHDLMPEKDIPLLFGSGTMDIKEDVSIIDIDIFATIFFMLTRWEEYVVLERDKHNRFLETLSLAYKYNFLERPIVNEYLEFLWNILAYMGFKEERTEHKSSLNLTHDIDEILRYPTIKKVFVRMAGDIVLRKSLLLFFKTAIEYIDIFQKRKKDPYDTFSELMDISESYNLKSSFFFMAGGTSSKRDNRYAINDKFLQETVSNIKERRHNIGIHPSYNAYNDFDQFEAEKKSLESLVKLPIVSGREHYLRFEVPTTWQIWNDNNMQWCSNMAYANIAGFRAGTCSSFYPFNILTQKKLQVLERPLIFMEATFITQYKDDLVELEHRIDYYIRTVKKYNGSFIVLWHNSNFHTHSAKKYAYLYKYIINKFQE